MGAGGLSPQELSTFTKEFLLNWEWFKLTSGSGEEWKDKDGEVEEVKEGGAQGDKGTPGPVNGITVSIIW